MHNPLSIFHEMQLEPTNNLTIAIECGDQTDPAQL